MKKKLLLVSCVFLALLGTSCTDNATETPKGEAATTRSVTSSNEKEIKSITLNEKLLSTFQLGRSGEASYPSYYGGSYVDDNGELIVLVKGNQGEATKDLGVRLKSPEFQILACEYSYQELYDLNKKLGLLYDNSQLREKLNWVSIGMQIVKNRVIVYLGEISEQAISQFKEQISDSPMIIFDGMTNISYDAEIEIDSIVQDRDRATTPANLHMGATISSSSGTGSVGFRAMRGTTNGFITAAHVVQQTGVTIKSGTTNCGTVTAICKGPQADAAFISVDKTNFYPTNVTQWTKTTLLDDYITNSALVNVQVVAEGQTTQKAIGAKVTSINNKIVVGNFTVSNMVFAEFTDLVSKPGDSGCIVYGSIAKKWAGVLSGTGVSTSTGKTNLLFSSAELTLSALGASKNWVKY